MSNTRRAVALAMAIVMSAAGAAAQPPFSDSVVITGFQRAVDAYAFQHRQVERRAGDTPDQRRMAAALRATRPSVEAAGIFTPVVAAAFRARLAFALRNGCAAPEPGDSFVVPRANQDATGASPIAGCLTAVLPRLPAELEYRARGVALLLVDTHANMVVDTLHAAFPARASP